MNPERIRDMPVVRATEVPGHGWVVRLPNGDALHAETRAEAARLIDELAPWSAIDWRDDKQSPPPPTSASSPGAEAGGEAGHTVGGRRKGRGERS